MISGSPSPAAARTGTPGPPALAGATALARRRYDRLAPIYDLLDGPMELEARIWRREQWAGVGAERVLEVGVGTGKSLRYHPAAAKVTAIDLSPRMLARARERADEHGSHVDLRIADAQALPFADASFEVVIVTFVLCSVPDPVLGLREIRRVLAPGGRLSMVEHVLSRKWWLRPIMKALDPVTTALWGAHIDRDTVANVERAGFSRVESRDLALDVVKAILARP
jgi:phosphatidylethanolamine/phosphatidyl-N-methylethanolamine N-methyltransferase